MSSIRRRDQQLRRWERYLRRYRTSFGDMTVRSQRGHHRAWEALSAAHRNAYENHLAAVARREVAEARAETEAENGPCIGMCAGCSPNCRLLPAEEEPGHV